MVFKLERVAAGPICTLLLWRAKRPMRVRPGNGSKSGETPRLYKATICKKPLPYESEQSLLSLKMLLLLHYSSD